jgi:hypothetical protein
MFLSKSEILQRLKELDKKLEGVPSPAEVLIVGGSALALLGESRMTSDIDYIGSLTYMPKEYLSSLGFSGNVKTFFALYGTDEYSSYELNGFKNLKVRVLSYEDLAVMKLFSTRAKDLDDLINYIFPKLSSYTSLKKKIETYKEYYYFDVSRPDLHVNQLDYLKSRLKKEKKIIIVEDLSITLKSFLKSIRIYSSTERQFGKESLEPWLSQPLGSVIRSTSILGYLYTFEGIKVLF